MTEITFINVQTRAEFDEVLDLLSKATIIGADTETNGLRYYRDNYIISMSLFFPEYNVAVNLPFRHGEGTIDIPYTDKTTGVAYEDMSWQGKTKSKLYLRYWWEQFKAAQDENYFGNLPIEWLDEVKALWGRKGVTYVFHNARFDLHMLNAEGFPVPDIVEDTMLALHLVNEDWNGIEVTAPYKDKNTKKWAIDNTGKPFKKKQFGNRQLKWQSMYWNLPNAHVGETELMDAKKAMEGRIATYIADHIHDPYNNGLVYADIRDDKDGAWDKWGEKQLDRIIKKLDIDSKAEMWMLPSEDVALYAMLDTVLTVMLRDQLMPVLERWDNVDLYYNVCDIQLKVAWQMEVNGLQLDIEEAYRQIATYEPRIAEIEAIANDIADALSEALGTEKVVCTVCNGSKKVSRLKEIENEGLAKLESVVADMVKELDLEGYEIVKPEPEYIEIEEDCTNCNATGEVDKLVLEPTVNLSSPKQLAPFLRYAVQAEYPLDDIIPDWVDGEVKASLDNRGMTVKRGQLLSTNREAIRPFEEHPVVWLVLEHRKLNKTVNTYLKNWINARDKNNVVRGNMNADGTVAGRFSSSGEMGNLQNIPERNGYTIKQVFVTPEGYIKWAVDYGQLEARVAAWIAETLLPEEGAYNLDKRMMTDLFNEGADMHSYVRDMLDIRGILFGNMTDVEILISRGIDPNTIDESEHAEYVNVKICRQTAKTLNFGLLYSGTYYMLMRLLRIGEAEAKELERRWRALFPAFELAQKHYEDLSLTWRATPTGKGQGMYATQPITGRHRKLHMYDTNRSYFDNELGIWRTFNPRYASARKVWNNTVQGLSGWMSTNAALRFAEDHTWDGIKPYAQIHDALDGDVRLDSLHKIPILIDYMLDYPTNPPLTADLEAGYNWQPFSKANPKGMRKVKDVDLWVLSHGREGYK